MRSKASSKRTNGVFDAVVFQRPDLSFHLRLQNLICFFIDYINNFAEMSENNPLADEQIVKCIVHIEEIVTSDSDALNSEIKQYLSEFLEDAHCIAALIKDIYRSVPFKTPDQTLAVTFTAKTSHVQWLSVRIIKELKAVYENVNQGATTATTIKKRLTKKRPQG